MPSTINSTIAVFSDYSGPLAVWSIVINWSVCLSVCLRAYRSTDQYKILYVNATVAVARSSSDGVALRYVLPVSWMTS